MTGQDRQSIEEPLTHSVSLGQLKNDSLWVHFAHSDRFPADNQEVSLRGMHVFVEIHPEREKHIIGIERLPVRKFYSFPEHECVGEPVWGDLPGFCQARFCQLSSPIDMDKVCLHDPDDFAGSGICGD
jgi:hypothetical protein